MSQAPPDPLLPPLVSATRAAEILGVHRNTVIYRAEKRRGRDRLVGVRLDGGTGQWVFSQAYIEWVASQFDE